MKRTTFRRIAPLAFALSLFAGVVNAQPVIYSNGAPAIGATGGGDRMGPLRLLSDDFVLGSSATIGGIRFYGAAFSTLPFGYSGSVTWAITNDVNGTPGSTLASGVASPVGVLLDASGGFVTNQYDFSITSLFLGAGTYRLQLQDPNATANLFWTATSTKTGNYSYDALDHTSRGVDVAFALLGPSTVVPEPTTVTLLASGLLAMAFITRKRRA